jgi:hypothetical protein
MLVAATVAAVTVVAATVVAAVGGNQQRFVL